MAQPDLARRAGLTFGRESQVVQKRHQPIACLVVRSDPARHLGASSASRFPRRGRPRPPCPRRRPRRPMPASALGEQLVVAGPGWVHPRCARNIRGGRPGVRASARPGRPVRRGRGPEVEPHGVRVHTEPVGDLDDAHRRVRGPQHVQDITASIRHRHSPCGGNPATKVCPPRAGPSLRRAARRPQRRSPPVEGVGEEHCVVGQVRHQIGGQVVLVVDRLDRAHRLTRPTVDALVWLDVEAATRPRRCNPPDTPPRSPGRSRRRTAARSRRSRARVYTTDSCIN